MSDKIALAFCVHSHQPVGNDHSVFEQGSRDCYLPFLNMLQNYPQIRMTLHYTGPLLEWFEHNQPDFFDLLRQLAGRNQIELLGGGFYEPILPVIPLEDVRDQIKLARNYIKTHFDSDVRGLWCAERIWDPGMPKKLAGLDMEYTLLDDSHFLSAGIAPEDVHGYYVTEREGCPIKVFPIDMQLRYLIPFKEPQETIDYLRRLRDRGVRIATYGDDGEKFGMWPGTRKWVYDDGWMQRFMDAMSAVSDEIEIIPLKDAIDAHPPQGRAYLPTATYQEMMEWSLQAGPGRYYEDLIKEAKNSPDWAGKRAFLRGGMWDNFLAKYRESNLMHKKMLRVSRLVRDNGNPEEALRHLLMAQCNCAYWHGLFGGIYIRGLRHAIYEHLLQAEALIDASRLKKTEWLVETTDHDLDGRNEILVSGRKLNFYIAPHENAAVFALDYKPKAYCLSNILMRHEEIYHREIFNNEGHDQGSSSAEPLSIHDIPHGDTGWLKEVLTYDTCPRNSFVTHYLDAQPDLEQLLRENRVSASRSADLAFSPTARKGLFSLGFQAAMDGFEITKTYAYHDSEIVLTHNIQAADPGGWVVLEWNLMILSAEWPAVNARTIEKDRGIFRGMRVDLKDSYKDLLITLESEMPWDIVIVPIECASQCESGFEKTFQGWTVYLAHPAADLPEIKFRVR